MNPDTMQSGIGYLVVGREQFLNRERFTPPADGLYMIASKGEHPHDAGVVQVIDDQAMDAMIESFLNSASKDSSLLIDFEHSSYDAGKSSQAAGWITELVKKPEGLFAKVRWTDLGEEALANGRYRFISPVWLKRDVTPLAGNKVRPLRLDSAGLTNTPNLNGLIALSNRGDAANASAADTKPQPKGTMKSIATKLGLSAEASKDAILAEVTKLQNRATTAEQEVTTLKDQATKKDAIVNSITKERDDLVGAVVDADLEKFASRIKPEQKDAIRAQLLANRAATLIVLNGMAEPKEQKKLKADGTPADASDFKALVNDKVKAGKSKTAAVAEVMKENPKAHVEWMALGCPAL